MNHNVNTPAVLIWLIVVAWAAVAVIYLVRYIDEKTQDNLREEMMDDEAVFQSAEEARRDFS